MMQLHFMFASKLNIFWKIFNENGLMNFSKEIPLILVIFELVQPTKNTHLKLNLFFSILEHFLVYILQLLWEYFTYKHKKYPLSEIVKPKLQKRSRDNILQITISAHIYVVKKMAV